MNGSDEPMEVDARGDRVLLVAPGVARERIVRELRDQRPDLSFDVRDSYLSAISDLSGHPYRYILAHACGALPRLDDAVAGLREAAGHDARIVLCCAPEHEPAARRGVEAGADDYILLPVQADELGRAFGLPKPYVWRGHALTSGDALFNEELELIGHMLDQVDGKSVALLETLAKLVRRALGATGVTVVVSGSVATAGTAVTRPVLTVPLTPGGDVRGQILVAESERGPYQPAQVRRLAHYGTIAGNILAARFARQRWRDLARTDELTGLPNRRHFREALDEALTQARRQRHPVTLLLFDIDDFKTYNDDFGHDVGDEILRTTARLFRENCREHDLVARYGGDEFVVVFFDPEGPRVAGSQHPDRTLDVLKRFRAALRSHAFRALGHGGRGQLTISGGLASFPWDADTADALITEADRALLEAKRAGKDRIYLIGERRRPRNSATG